MSRFEQLQKLMICPMNGKLWNKLTPDEKTVLQLFVQTNEDLSFDDYAFKCNRWMIDSNNKPKHATDMWALALQSNTKEK